MDELVLTNGIQKFLDDRTNIADESWTAIASDTVVKENGKSDTFIIQGMSESGEEVMAFIGVNLSTPFSEDHVYGRITPTQYLKVLYHHFLNAGVNISEEADPIMKRRCKLAQSSIELAIKHLTCSEDELNAIED